MCLNFGDDMKNATEVFEFFADNTDNIEFSFLGFASSNESEESSTFIVGTSYEEKGDHYSSKGAERLAEQGLLRQYNHNHPNGDMRPSNILNNGFFIRQLHLVMTQEQRQEYIFYLKMRNVPTNVHLQFM